MWTIDSTMTMEQKEKQLYNSGVQYLLLMINLKLSKKFIKVMENTNSTLNQLNLFAMYWNMLPNHSRIHHFLVCTEHLQIYTIV